jgi:hypothetical protein
MSAPLAVILFGIVSIALFVWWLMVLIQALRVPDPDWAAAGQSKILWVLVMVFLGALGTILYVVIARPGLGRPSDSAV